MSQEISQAESFAYDNCTAISIACPLEATIYGYTPSLGGNAVLLGINALAGLVSLGLGIRYKTWTYMLGLSLGCLTQSIGYVGRIMMHNNPWDGDAFTIQITCLIIGPAFVSASIYLTLKHFALTFGPEYSIIKPQYYTYMFIAADFLSIALQGAGGGLASAAETPSESDLGGNIMLAGIVWQVVSLAAFGILGLLYLYRVWTNRSSLSHAHLSIARSFPFRAFVAAVVIAYVTILIRCIYRIPELAGGWRNELMRREIDFVILDSVMMAIAVVVLTVAHPGFCFPQMARPIWGKKENSKSFDVVEKVDDSSDGSMEERGTRGVSYQNV